MFQGRTEKISEFDLYRENLLNNYLKTVAPKDDGSNFVQPETHSIYEDSEELPKFLSFKTIEAIEEKESVTTVKSKLNEIFSRRKLTGNKSSLS